MRVIAGSAGGLSLYLPKSDLRPTMDVVKGAIYSSLGDFIVGARVLDLFAGIVFLQNINDAHEIDMIDVWLRRLLC